MNATVIDTLRFSDRLKDAGFEARHAEGMARALGDELAERIVTRSDLDEGLRPIHTQLDAMKARIDAMEVRFDAMEARFDTVEARIDSVHRELSGKFNMLMGVMALGFTLLTGLGGYNAVSPRFAPSAVAAPDVQDESTGLPATPTPAPLEEG